MAITKTPQLLVVGLGNLPYPNTRHSVGHLIVDALSSRYGIPLATNRAMGGLFGRGSITLGETPVSLLLLKPKPLMNITGPAVASALRNTVQSPNSMVVIHDSLSHKPCVLSPKLGGSANGHNGVRSVISALGNNTDFHRLRIGIGRGGPDVADYVLSKLPPEERQFWCGEGLDLVSGELARLAAQRSQG
ncbi:peptidyl-tRNA hydrolase [Coniophora puteana RWD-64-598 SS2]|uniref:peptidyl-tRNA hydrolase n=1 Tax=Coniophora puteana (strain RWD-64-598) TaxID=741705 RepID=A0A5M3MUZ2_CONPW|nr:peptidyl-tRNA hydrolase [Coniophora puteana RWD-64-598 SS2]EIW82817.1 peptidyl-tRNA hydrolase [Coniophora puteana RWD-64-598 SS2]